MAMLDDAATDLQQTVAALRRELELRTAERDEALAQQTATSEILGVISRSPADIQPVFEAIVARAAALCEAEFSAVARLDDGLLHLVAVHSMSPEETAAFHSLFPRPPTRNFTMGRAFVDARPVHFADVLSEFDYDTRTIAVLQSVAKYRSFLGVPIFREGRPIGVIGCGRREVKPFTPAQIELVKTFADQAAIAIENVRLFGALAARNRDLGEALEQQTATAEILQVINSSPGDLGPVFESILDKAHVLCGATLGTLFLYDGEKLCAAATHGYPEDLANELRRGVGVFPNSGPAALLAGARLVHRPDITQVGDPVARAVSQRGGVRTNLLVPLRKGGAFLGIISCNRKEVRPYTDKEIALIENFAAQAVIAIENARLMTETREALEQQTATAEVLQVINSSPDDLAPVFDALLDQATRLCDFAFSILWTYDGEAFRAVAMHGVPPRYAEYLAGRAIVPPVNAEGAFSQFVAGRDFLHIDDVAAVPLDRLTPRARGAVEIGGARTNMLVALRKEGILLGAIEAYRLEVRPFTEKQIALLENFAAQAVIAMENARLLGELQQRTDELAARNSEFGERIEHQSATIDVLKAMSASPADPQPVFDLIARRARDLCNTNTASVFEFDGELVHFRSVVRHGAYVTPDAAKAYERLFPMVPTRGSLSCRAILDRQTIHVRDMASEPGVSAAVRNLGYKSHISLPLLRDGAAIGAISMNANEPGGFTDSQVALLQTFAEQAVIAITSAETYRELRQRTDDLQESLEYQTATSDVLNVISRSTSDVQPVLDTVIETAARLCAADTGTISIREGEIYRSVASSFSAAEPEYWAIMRQRTIVPGRDSIPARVALEGRVVHVADIRADPDYALPETVASGRRTMLGVPLLRQGEVLGTINLARKRVEPFSERQIELVRTFADQAVIAMENARLLSELHARTRDLEESLEYQTATSDVLKVISRSTAEVQPVLDTVVEAAARLCVADAATMLMREGGVYRYVAASAVDTEYWAILRQRTVVPGRGGVARRVALEGGVVHVADIRADPDYAGSEAAKAGRRTQLGVPLLRDSEPIGIIMLSRKRIEPFSERQIELVRTFADQAVIAIENARLLGELQARTGELTRSVAELQALEEVARAVNSSLDLDTVLATVIGRAVLLSQADEGMIYEFDEAEEVFVPKSAFGMSAERVEALRERRIKLGETHLGRSAIERAPVYVADVQQDPSVPHAARTLPGIHAVLAVPLLREDKVVGGLVIRRRSEAGFAPTIATLMQTFAAQSVLAIENARLFQELAARGEEARRAHAAAENALADLRRAQDRLIQAEKMASLGQLTAGIAHEIKNPLNFVNNFAGLSVELLDELKETAAPAVAQLGDDTRAEIDEIVGMLTSNLEKIAEHGRRADGIVKSMLEHSRGGSGERREVDLNNLVEEALNLAYHGARAQDQNFNVTLERDFAAAIAPIELVPQDVTRVLLNLIGNGFYAATKRRRGGAEPDFRPALKVATYDLGEAVEIRIRDNGTGIPPEIRDRLFQPFFTTKPTGEGTGLGLSISWDIVTQQHGGTIAVDSRPGKFTEFTIRLPRA